MINRQVSQSDEADKSSSWGWNDLPENPSATLRRLADQIDFFDQKSMVHKRTFKILNTSGLIAAAIITVSAALSLPEWVVPVLGASIVVLNGQHTMNRSHENWLIHRSTCEALKHEKYLFLANAGVYRDVESPESLLAERIEDLLQNQYRGWLQASREKKKESEPMQPK